jgi:hypothetical protein
MSDSGGCRRSGAGFPVDRALSVVGTLDALAGPVEPPAGAPPRGRLKERLTAVFSARMMGECYDLHFSLHV